MHQQRKEQYTKLIPLLIKIFVLVNNSKEQLDPKSIFNQDDWLDCQLGMSMYASEEVLEAYTDMMDILRQKSEPPGMINRRLGDLILTMRKEVGFKDSN